jgi:hypothetical protein
MTHYIRKSMLSLVTASALVTGVALPANAANNAQQDGLINLAVGDVNVLNDANIGVVAQVAANVCGVNVGPVAVLGRAVDRSGATTTVCTTGDQAVRLIQN